MPQCKRSVQDKHKRTSVGFAHAAALLLGIVLGVLVMRVYDHGWLGGNSEQRLDVAMDIQQIILSRSNDCALTEEQWDIAEANLLCASGLPGAEGLDIKKCLQIVDRWSAAVARETKRNAHRFSANPRQYNNSKAEYHMGILVTVLKQDLGVSYSPKLASISADFSNNTFERDARNLFIHGLLMEPQHGSCASIPVLITAVGRRLGYPVFLVATKGHLFVRWDDGRERLNVDAACAGGFTTHDDDHYLHWPMETSPQETGAFHYLQPMTPKEELATFLGMRAQCLVANAADAADPLYCLVKAHALAPDNAQSLLLLASLAESACRSRHGFVSGNSEQ